MFHHLFRHEADIKDSNEASQHCFDWFDEVIEGENPPCFQFHTRFTVILIFSRCTEMTKCDAMDAMDNQIEAVHRGYELYKIMPFEKCTHFDKFDHYCLCAEKRIKSNGPICNFICPAHWKISFNMKSYEPNHYDEDSDVEVLFVIDRKGK
jgi:hypothetical protein